MEDSSKIFKDAIDKAYTRQPNVKLNATTMGDALKFKSSFTEEKTEDISKEDQKEMVDGIVEIVKKVKDINNRKLIVKDMIKKFKKENIKTDIKKFMKDCGIEIMDKKETNEDMDSEYVYETFLQKRKRMDNNEVKNLSEAERTIRAKLKDLALKYASKDTDNKPKKEKVEKIYGELVRQFYKGVRVEKEHESADLKLIALDHLEEDPKYYDKLEKIETKEATGSGSSGAYSGPVFGGDDAFWERSRSETPKLKESDVEKVEAKEATTSGSVGGYETPAMWAKSTSKKDWGPSRKTQIPGGGFVKIKKKCTKFPYCNQGDISNLKISKNESVKEAIDSVAKKMGISPNVIKTILEHEYENVNKRTK